MNGVAGYDIDVVLGEGAMGTVYRARQRASGGRVVALKRLRAGGNRELVERIRREGEVLAALDHPHVVRIFEMVEDGASIAIAMQYAPGGSLADLLTRRGRLSPDELVALAAPIADALASAHRRGVLHRDVKPANVLFTSDGEPLLSDFGTARWSVSGPLTAPGGGWGTAEYLDPATADGSEADERSDVYSLGVMCYEALTGQRPYHAPTPLGLLRAADRGLPLPVVDLAPDVPAALAATVERAIARSPSDRFQGAAALAAALRTAAGPDLAKGGPVLPRVERRSQGTPSAPDPATRAFGPRPPPPDERDPAPPQRVPWLAVAAVALVLLLMPLAVVGLTQVGGAGAEPDTAPAAVAARPASVCPPSGAPPAAAGERILEGDLDGDGCPSWVRWRDTLLEVPREGAAEPVRFELGAPGDLLVLGDWDCDGADTPGLYRPETGEVFLFHEWAAVGEPLRSGTAIATGRTGGTPSVIQRGGCDSVEVT